MSENFELTEEQINIINHPDGYHGLVLAVAGSGKTTTLAHRVKHLILDKQVDPFSIRILMFNRLIEKQFNEKLKELISNEELLPKAHTFHSFTSLIIHDYEREKKIKKWISWVEKEKERLELRKCIDNYEKSHHLDEGSIDLDEAEQAIQLFKSDLIEPRDAGYTGNPNIVGVYKAFEYHRKNENAITYNDFVPLAIHYLQTDTAFNLKHTGSIKYLIIDEYQDINLGQQKLIELLSRNKPDIMVVGDDDQTIYEWRGARPEYILHDFRKIFQNKQCKTYKLSNTFRFGPVLAISAYNSISHNELRASKHLISLNDKKETIIEIFNQQKNSEDVNRSLSNEVVKLVMDQKINPSSIKVLCRLYSQLSSLEADFLARGIPYRILDKEPFFQSKEIRVILKYLLLGLKFDNSINETIFTSLLDVINIPNRRLNSTRIKECTENAKDNNWTVRNLLSYLKNDNFFTVGQKNTINKLSISLSDLHQTIAQKKNIPLYLVIKDLVDSIDYINYLENYYGNGEQAFEKTESILNFINYAKDKKMCVDEFLGHIRSLDSTRGAPDNQQIVMTSVFKTKGLEFDYVIIPNCNKGYMPCLRSDRRAVFNTNQINNKKEQSNKIEQERRLFYVALTRGIKAVYVSSGSSNSLEEKVESEFLDEMKLDLVNTFFRFYITAMNGNIEKIKSFFKNFSGPLKMIENVSYYTINLHNDEINKTISSTISRLKVEEQKKLAKEEYNQKTIMPIKNKDEKLHEAWYKIK